VARKLVRQLDFLNRARVAGDMKLPGFRFHSLRGNRSGTYTVARDGKLPTDFQIRRRRRDRRGL
jgi:plasmid maintenance system killer protein